MDISGHPEIHYSHFTRPRQHHRFPLHPHNFHTKATTQRGGNEEMSWENNTCFPSFIEGEAERVGGERQKGLLVRNGREMGLTERKVSERIAAQRREQLGREWGRRAGEKREGGEHWESWKRLISIVWNKTYSGTAEHGFQRCAHANVRHVQHSHCAFNKHTSISKRLLE